MLYLFFTANVTKFDVTKLDCVLYLKKVFLENESEESSGDENKNKMSMAQRIRMKIKRNANEVKSTATPEEVYDEEYDEPVKKTKVSALVSTFKQHS